ncbi:enolase C-terminal domain-like protein [Dactylosporangium sp. NPDC051485]|uniref:enolase C-terminal domain-like protein n=1 Tax=Dactylosporangium sp. NPDC051485 TaxID=3154846 RepID=UPI00341797A5
MAVVQARTASSAFLRAAGRLGFVGAFGLSASMRVAALAAVGLELSGHCAPALHLDVAAAVPNLRHLEYFHDHVRIESMLFDGVASPTAGGVLRPDRSAPGHGLTFKTADANPYLVAAGG